jgi:hypothetical protein
MVGSPSALLARTSRISRASGGEEIYAILRELGLRDGKDMESSGGEQGRTATRPKPAERPIVSGSRG